MKRFAIVVCVVGFIVCGHVGAYAETPDSSSFPTAFNTFGISGLYSLVSPDTAGPGVFSAGAAIELFESSLPKDVRTPGMLQLRLLAGYSLTDAIDVGFALPYQRLDVSDEGDLEGFDESGIGDITASLKFRLLAEGEAVPGLGLFGMASFPTGNADLGLGSGTYDFTLGAAVAKHIAPLRVYGNLAFLYSGWKEGEPNPLFDTYQHTLRYGLGMELPADNERVWAFSELTFVHEFGGDADDAITTFRGQDAQPDPVTGLLPDFARAADPVDDAGQATVGVRVALLENLLLTGGGSLQILGDAAVPDAPKMRGFLNVSWQFGGSSAATASTKSSEMEVLTAPEEIVTSGNQCPAITNVSLSDELIRGGDHVRIAVNADDPDDDAMYYFWVSYYGTLTGQAAQVVWTAPECEALENSTREYELQVEVNDGACTVDRVLAVSVICGSGESGQAQGRIPERVILFASGSTGVDNIAKAKLDTLAALLKQFPDTAIMLEGHTDATGAETVNHQIGLKRAESVKAYLIRRHGLDPQRISTTSYGSQRPAASNDTAEGRAQNRRVEVYQGL